MEKKIGKRPELGTVKMGDEVIVYVPNGKRGVVYQGRVSKVARVWITVANQSNGFPSGWRFRLDTQDDGVNSAYRTVFRTPEQYAWDQRAKEAAEFLQNQRIDTFAGPWNKPERMALLADAVRKILTELEASQ